MRREFRLFNAEASQEIDLSSYDLIGFASGIDFGGFYPSVISIAEKLPKDKKVFAMFTCASINKKMAEEIRKRSEKRGCEFVGKYGCKGYNTYGAWKLIGGMNKNHPNENEVSEAESFINNLMK